jgi:hypothetical protein
MDAATDRPLLLMVSQAASLMGVSDRTPPPTLRLNPSARAKPHHSP